MERAPPGGLLKELQAPPSTAPQSAISCTIGRLFFSWSQVLLPAFCPELTPSSRKNQPLEQTAQAGPQRQSGRGLSKVTLRRLPTRPRPRSLTRVPALQKEPGRGPRSLDSSCLISKPLISTFSNTLGQSLLENTKWELPEQLMPSSKGCLYFPAL